MRRNRIKGNPTEGASNYHCMSRTVNSEWLFAEADREALRELIWVVAEFCGVEVVTYVVLSNHFHILLRVPETVVVASQEVLRRYSVLYPAPSHYRTEQLEVLRREVEAGTPDGVAWLEKQRRQMGDVSHYMKILKQRFTVLFNLRHKRHGTLWAERFKSKLVEEGLALCTTAAYIDLNPVRADLVDDPKDYRFCGYAEAVAGAGSAQRGLCLAVGKLDWQTAAEPYRHLLFGAACTPRSKGRVLEVGALLRVIETGGKLPQHELLRCRLRYLTEGAVLGSASFVQKHLDKERQKYNRVRGLQPKKLPPLTDWGGLTILRRPRAGICLSQPDSRE
ncbi:MAG: transposase [Opitutaceae bacterium]|nr:transposase [Opitutaceae bacterium]